MKRKTLLLLTTSILGMGIIGGTFAGWAITDNAPAVDIKVSPGAVAADTTTTYATMYYGSSQSISNVSGLQRGAYRKAGVLDLRADTSNHATFNGKLTLAVADSNSTTGLAAKLHVEVFKTDLASTDGIVSSETYAAAASNKLTFTNGVSQTITVADDAESLYSVIVYLDSSVTVTEYDSLSNKQATITLNWDHAYSSQDLAQSTTLYAAGFGKQVYCYAWNDNETNKAFPGEAMTLSSVADTYYYAVPTKYTKVIFTTADESKKSGDLTVASFFTGNNNMFTYTGTGDAKGTAGEFDDSVESVYYLVGNTALYVGDNTSGTQATWAGDSMNEALKLTFTDGVATKNVYTSGNAELKFWNKTSNQYYDNDGGNFSLGDAGKYTLTFRLNPGAGQAYIEAAQRQ